MYEHNALVGFRLMFDKGQKQSSTLSCDSSYSPCVSLSCPLYKSKTVKDISMKLKCIIKHDETMCYAQEPSLLLSYLSSYFPLIIFHTISCPLCNSKTKSYISMKLGTLIKINEMMCRA